MPFRSYTRRVHGKAQQDRQSASQKKDRQSATNVGVERYQHSLFSFLFYLYGKG
jgi:hypothetical protein